VKALLKFAAPPAVLTCKSTTPPLGETGVEKVTEVPSGFSVQSDIDADPTEIAVMPTRNDPEIVTDAPPVFGITDLLTAEIVGD